MKKIKKYIACATLLCVCVMAQAQMRRVDDMADSFRSPPDSIRPYVYWYWINDHVSPSGVVKDLEAMKRIGIGGAFIGNIGLRKEEGTSYGNAKLFSHTWWDATETAMETAGKLDITLGMFNGPGWSQSGGPWVKPESSMRYIASRVEHIKGGRKIVKQIKSGSADSVYLFSSAFPSVVHAQFDVNAYKPALRAQPKITDVAKLMDGDRNITVAIPSMDNTCTVDISFPNPFTARSLVLYPSANPFSATITLQVLQGDKVHTVSVCDFNRSNTSLQTGFHPEAPLSLSFPVTESTKYRLIFTNMAGDIRFSEIALSPAEVLSHYSEKQLAKMYSTPLPLWDAYRWKPQTEPMESSHIINPSTIIQLDKFVDTAGQLQWKAPKGDWSLIHYYAVPTGVTNSPTSAEGKGLEIDKMDASKLPIHFDAFIGKVLKRIPESKRKTFRYMVADSYEVGSQTWVDDFQNKFKATYHYDPLPYLPVLSGVIVGSADQSDRFLWDLRRLVADLVATEYVGGLRKLGNQHGLKLWLENYGHWGFPSEFLKYGGQSDEVAGEFWNEGDLGNIENRSASSAAHIYGKKRVWAESFTAGGLEYSRYPALLKRRGDWVFTEGVNQTLLHLYIHQTDEQKDPGINAWFSTEFNRKNTWFDASSGYIDYLRRCNFLLQQGISVNEIAYFIGEDAPIMTGTRHPEKPEGYDYDYVNADVIQNMYVKDGRVWLPSGASYHILVLPPTADMRPNLLSKIKQLVSDGAVILGTAPGKSPSLEDYPAADEAVRKDAALLWHSEEITAGIRRFGKGLVMDDISLEKALAYIGLQPDFSTNVEEAVSYTHRRTPDHEIYFVTNQSEQKIKFEAFFRVKSGAPYWFDPVTGKIRPLGIIKRSNLGTTISLTLDLAESGFVVFDLHEQELSLPSHSNFPVPDPIKQINTPWNVTFKDLTSDNRDSLVIFARLNSWVDHPDVKIRDFSGSAIYTNKFHIDQATKNEILYLETEPIVGIATVRVNGKSVGTLWTAPWRVEISDAVQQGENKIEIEVASTWKNRLIAEKKLPEDKWSMQVDINNYTADSTYDRSGLTGAVVISRLGSDLIPVDFTK